MALIARSDKFSEYLREIDTGAAIQACPEALEYYHDTRWRPATLGDIQDDLVADGPVPDYTASSESWSFWAWAVTRSVLADDARHVFCDMIQSPSRAAIALRAILIHQHESWVIGGLDAYEEAHLRAVAGALFID